MDSQEPAHQTTNTVIVGAGPAGLSVAACLKQAEIGYILLEKSEQVGSAWHRHYDRLHLHTDKRRSELPFLPSLREYPRYLSRLQVVEYLEAYRRHFQIEPRFGQEVIRASRKDGHWITQTSTYTFTSTHLVIATGYNRKPNVPVWPGMGSFTGEMIHSSEYKNGLPYKGKRVLVIGFGNSGAEIAIDLCEHGVQPTLSVRSPVNVLPRELFGIPILAIAISQSKLPAAIADALNRPILRLKFGDLRALGLQKAVEGPNVFIQKSRQIPVIDVGTIQLIRQGKIVIRPGVDRFKADGVVFVDGRVESFEAVILATGYRPAIDEFLDTAVQVSDSPGTRYLSGRETPLPGLFFCGFNVVSTGMLREIAIEARQIARIIAKG